MACDRPPHHVLDERPRGAAGLAHAVGAVLRDEVGRIQPCGMIITTACTGYVSWNAYARSAARAPASSESNARIARLREPAEQAEVRLPQRRAARGHRVLDARLHEPDHVGVALDHVDLAAARDRGARARQVEQHLVLLVDRRLGGVQVLRLLARARIGRQDPGAESDPASLGGRGSGT
jgi:hypothetical protein